MVEQNSTVLEREAKQAAARRSTWVSVVVNVGLTTGQIVAGLVTGSLGLVADGFHSASDLVADFVVLVANHHSARDADEDHHYGHYRYENAATLLLGLLLLVVGLGMAYSAVNALIHPPEASVQILALYVALGALVCKELLFRYMKAVALSVRSEMLMANAWHARTDAASSLVVAVGIVGALAGYPMLDAIAATLVGLVIAKMGWSYAWGALSDLMDRAADQEAHEAIEGLLLATPGVQGLHDLRTRKVGDFILVDVHLEVDGALTVRQGHEISVLARQRVMQRQPVLNVMTHLDPV